MTEELRKEIIEFYLIKGSIEDTTWTINSDWTVDINGIFSIVNFYDLPFKINSINGSFGFGLNCMKNIKNFPDFINGTKANWNF